MACFTFYCRLPRAAVFVKWNCCVKCNRSIVIPCCLVAGYQRFEEGCTNFCFILQTRLVGSRNKYLAWILLLLLLLLLCVKGVFSLVLFLNQHWSLPLRLQVSDFSSFCIMRVVFIIIIIIIIIIVVADTCECSNEPSGFIKCREFLD